MATVNMTINGPYQRKGEDVIVTIKKIIDENGLPPKIEVFHIQLKGLAKTPDEEIGRIAMSQIWEHFKRTPGDI